MPPKVHAYKKNTKQNPKKAFKAPEKGHRPPKRSPPSLKIDQLTVK
jgi:hypothetical protein